MRNSSTLWSRHHAAAADKLTVGWCGGMSSSKGVSGYEQQANVTSPMADISRMLPTGGGHMRIGGKVRAHAHFKKHLSIMEC
jgi:hypothetical protein